MSTFRHEIPHGKIAEELRALASHYIVRYSFRASSVVDFNVHFHRGNAVEYLVRKDAVTEDASSFVALSVEKFCWMWSNRNAAPVIVQGEIVSRINLQTLPAECRGVLNSRISLKPHHRVMPCWPHYPGVPVLGLASFVVAALLGLRWARAVLRSGRLWFWAADIDRPALEPTNQRIR